MSLGLSINIDRRRLKRLPQSLKGTHKAVYGGFPASKTPHEVLMHAIWNYFGTSRGIPPRPFIDHAINRNQRHYVKIIERSAKAILLGDASLDEVLISLGLRMAKDIRTAIILLKRPHNAPSTIKQKGFDNPLIDSGEMANSTTYELI